MLAAEGGEGTGAATGVVVGRRKGEVGIEDLAYCFLQLLNVVAGHAADVVNGLFAEFRTGS